MNDIVIFDQVDRPIEVRLEAESVWLSIQQLTDLFGRDKSVISRHLKNIFATNELDRDSVVAKNATTAVDGKTYQVEYFNLDAIISVGYRVNSNQATRFRQWATRVLREHLTQGYSLNEYRLQQRGIEFEQALSLLSSTLTNQELVSPEGATLLSVISDYARSWSMLQGYDDQSLEDISTKQVDMRALGLDEVLSAVSALKRVLVSKGEASELFGTVRGEGLVSALATIEQGFGEELFYPNVASRAAHLLYFVIKNHPLTDGNKRTGAFLFLWYLNINRHLLAKPVDDLINDNTLVALALLVAESKPEQMELMIRLVQHFLLLKDS